MSEEQAQEVKMRSPETEMVDGILTRETCEYKSTTLQYDLWPVDADVIMTRQGAWSCVGVSPIRHWTTEAFNAIYGKKAKLSGGRRKRVSMEIEIYTVK